MKKKQNNIPMSSFKPKQNHSFKSNNLMNEIKTKSDFKKEQNTQFSRTSIVPFVLLRCLCSEALHSLQRCSVLELPSTVEVHKTHLTLERTFQNILVPLSTQPFEKIKL
jgi:hypothetical protein